MTLADLIAENLCEAQQAVNKPEPSEADIGYAAARALVGILGVLVLQSPHPDLGDTLEP